MRSRRNGLVACGGVVCVFSWCVELTAHGLGVVYHWHVLASLRAVHYGIMMGCDVLSSGRLRFEGWCGLDDRCCGG